MRNRKNWNIVKFSISTYELKIPIYELHRIFSFKVRKTLRESRTSFHLSLNAVFFKPRYNEWKVKWQWRCRVLVIARNKKLFVYFEWRIDIERQLCKERFTSDIVYRRHRSTQSCFGAKVSATVVATITQKGNVGSGEGWWRGGEGGGLHCKPRSQRGKEKEDLRHWFKPMR